MSTGVTSRFNISSAVKTEELAAKIGTNLRGGEIIELESDLGGGKTTFTRGLARGAGSHDKVSSPTFTLNQEYTAPRFKIAHFDFYRLGEPGIMTEELAEVIGDTEYVVVVEWGDIVHDVLPRERMTIQFIQSADEGRELRFSYPRTYEYLMKGLK